MIENMIKGGCFFFYIDIMKKAFSTLVCSDILLRVWRKGSKKINSWCTAELNSLSKCESEMKSMNTCNQQNENGIRKKMQWWVKK